MLLPTTGGTALVQKSRGPAGKTNSRVEVIQNRYDLSKLGILIIVFRPELAWIGTETNEFGTDEFMKWCEAVGTEPYLCLNFGTGTLTEG